MIEMFLKNILRASLISSIGIIVILLLRKSLFKKYAQAFNYYIWLAIVVEMLLSFKIPIYLSQETYLNLSNIFNNLLNTQKNKTVINLINVGNKTITNKVITNSDNCYLVHFYNLVACLWLIIGVTIAIYYIVTYLQFIKKLKKSAYDVSDDTINAIYSELLSEINIRKKIHLKFCKNISTPLGIGFSKSFILLPEVNYSSEEIRWILRHELIHFKRRDILYKAIVISATVVHWFNPLAYIMLKMVNSDCELSCDEVVIKNLKIGERKLYATTLISSIRLNKTNTLENNICIGFNNDKNILKRRLENMLNLKTKKKGILIGTLSTLLVASSLFSVQVFAKGNSNAQVKNTTKITQTPTESTIASVNSDSKLSVVKPTESLLKEQRLEFLKRNGEGTIALPRPNPERQVSFTAYTYSNAPADVKADYEANCKAANVIPAASDEILIPIK